MTGQSMHPRIAATCPKCAVTIQGKLSCCAEGGSWYGRCGALLDYTWAEGVQSCKGTSNCVFSKRGNKRVHICILLRCLIRVGAPKRAVTKIVRLACPKCGTREGTLSCCFKGGSWFPRCGRPGAYTWVQGLEACSSVALSAEVQAQANFSQIGTQLQNTDYTDAVQSGHNNVFYALALAALYIMLM